MNAPNPSPKVPSFRTVEEFVYDVPLYSWRSLEDYWHASARDFVSVTDTSTFRGYCLHCKATTIFKAKGGMELDREAGPVNAPQHARGYALPENKTATFFVVASCQFNSNHAIRLYLMVSSGLIQKIGQYPSFADLSKDEHEDVVKELPAADLAEYRRGVNLAAHDVGIASFVYLRRVFERLVRRHFVDHQKERGWSNDDFPARMDERIQFLKDYLPASLVEHRRVYGLLSEGLHDLTEQQCVIDFPVLRRAVVAMVREDQRRRREQQEMKALTRDLETMQKSRTAARGSDSES